MKKQVLLGFVDLNDEATLQKLDLTAVFNQFSESEREQLKQQLPWRQTQILAGRSLAKALIYQKFNLPAQAIKINFSLKKRPKLIAVDNYCPLDKMLVSFNIAHSGHLIACAVAGFTVGLDLERVIKRRMMLKIIKRYFNAAEYAQIIDKSLLDEDFYRFWTAKEAFLKKNTRSVWQIKKTPTFILEHFTVKKRYGDNFNFKFTAKHVVTGKESDYIGAISVDNKCDLLVAKDFWPVTAFNFVSSLVGVEHNLEAVF